MTHRVEALQRFSLKIFAAPAPPVAPRAIIPIFHRWIQERAVPGLLIDVADYAHLAGGPSVLLVAHEANYALDTGGGRPGLSYTRKQPCDGTLADRLAVAANALITAGRRLELDTAHMTGGGVTFPGNEIELVANDRLLTPRTALAEAALHDVLDAFAARIFGRTGFEIHLLADPDRLGFSVKAPGAVSLDTLSFRIK